MPLYVAMLPKIRIQNCRKKEIPTAKEKLSSGVAILFKGLGHPHTHPSYFYLF